MLQTSLEDKDLLASAVTARSTNEDLFHHTIQSHFQHFQFHPAEGVEEYASFADKMAQNCQLKYDYVTKSATIDRFLASTNHDMVEEFIESTPNELRLERDLWTLLQMMSSADVLKPIDHQTCQQQLDETLQNLPIIATIPDFINAAFKVDDRLKKDEILKAWLEKSVQDKVVSIPVPSLDPAYDTLQAINRSGKNSGKVALKSIHPDAQLTKDGMMMALVGDDKVDQERLWQLIWQLIRSGQLTEAQQIAHEHRVYWLAASLRGVDNHYYTMLGGAESQGVDSMDVDEQQANVHIARIGNLRQPVWARTCWKYAENLFNNRLNWKSNAQDATNAGLLEMSIYASLANHSKVLLASPYIQSWHDKVWIYVKAIYQHDMNHIIHTYRQRKVEHSQFYPGCNAKVMDAEHQLIDLLEMSLAPLALKSTDDIFTQVPVPTSLNAESILIHIQSAFIQGYHGLKKLIESGLWMKWIDAKEHYPGQSSILRVLCHVLLWIRFSPDQSSDQFRSLVHENLFYATLEAYMHYLIEQKHYHVVGQYSVYLSRHRRIQVYAELLLSIQHRNIAEVQAEETSRALAIAEQLFPEDVIEITRAVVSNAVFYLDMHPSIATASSQQQLTVFNKPVAEDIDGVLGNEQLNQVFSLLKSNPQSKAVVRSSSKKSTKIAAADMPKDTKLWFDSMHDLELQPQEQMRIETLRWLMLDPEHSFEGLHQANRLIVQFLRETSLQRVGLVRVILQQYLRSDIKEVGNDLLSDEWKRNEQQVQSILLSTNRRGLDGQEPSECDFLQRMLETKAGIWNSNTTKQHFWQRFVNTIEILQLWSEVVEQFHIQCQELVGDAETIASCLMRFYGQIQKISEESIVALQSLLEYSHDAEMESVSGYKELWEQSHVAIRARIEIILQDCMASLVSSSQHPGGNAAVGNKGTDEIQFVQDIQEVVDKIMAQLPLITNESYPTDRICKDLTQILNLSQASNSSEALLKSLNILQEVWRLVEEITSELQLQGSLLKVILTTHLQVSCMSFHVILCLGSCHIFCFI